MKAVFVSYNQALTDPMQEILDDLGVRGFTKWELTMGRGSFDGEPHYGTHAWPSMNSSMLMIVEDEKVAPLLDAFRKLDSQTKMQGSRAPWAWRTELHTSIMQTNTVASPRVDSRGPASWALRAG